MTITRKERDRWQGVGALRSWLRHALSRADSNKMAAAGEADDFDRLDQRDSAARSSVVVLPFPIHGDALLVRLADLLRQRFGTQAPILDPFLFEIVRGAEPKLVIDGKSHVAFLPNHGEFRLEIEVKPSTDIAIRTGDFDTLVEFVMHYIGARLGERPSGEWAS